MSCRPLLFAAAMFASLAVPVTAFAQAAPVQAQEVKLTFVPEARIDMIAGHTTAGHAGLSILMPVSNYFSAGITGAGGISETGFSARGDYFGRFSLDPYHRNPWEPYVGGGGSTRYDSGGPGSRTYLFGFAGLILPRAGGVVPGLEFGLGGGVRFGMTFRWAK